MKSHIVTKTFRISFPALIILILLIIGALVLYRITRDEEEAKTIIQAVRLRSTPNSREFSGIRHVFVIVMENHDWKDIVNNPDAHFINSVLLQEGSHAVSYYNVPEKQEEFHPSEPNYIVLESGTNVFPDHTFSTDNNPSPYNSTESHAHLTYLLDKAGFTWKSYQEDISGMNCPIKSQADYVPRHNPFVYFRDVSGQSVSEKNFFCKTHIRPLQELISDLKSSHLSNYNFITPNLQHDMHNGTIAQADQWLSRIVPVITNSKVFKKDGVLFMTWDEGSDQNDKNYPIGMIVVSPFAKKNYKNSLSYSHASYVKTIEEIFRVSPLLGLASDSKTRDLSDLFIN